MNQVKGSSVDLKYDFTGLNNFVKAMDATGKYVVKVGIFGNKTAREIAAEKSAKGGVRKTIKGSTGTLTNAEVGLIHELGSIERGIPRRSFLRMPLTQKSRSRSSWRSPHAGSEAGNRTRLPRPARRDRTNR